MWMQGIAQSMSGKATNVMYTRMFEIVCCYSKNSQASEFAVERPTRPMMSPIMSVMMDGEVEMKSVFL